MASQASPKGPVDAVINLKIWGEKWKERRGMWKKKRTGRWDRSGNEAGAGEERREKWGGRWRGEKWHCTDGIPAFRSGAKSTHSNCQSSHSRGPNRLSVVSMVTVPVLPLSRGSPRWANRRCVSSLHVETEWNPPPWPHQAFYIIRELSYQLKTLPLQLSLYIPPLSLFLTFSNSWARTKQCGSASSCGCTFLTHLVSDFTFCFCDWQLSEAWSGMAGGVLV